MSSPRFDWWAYAKAMARRYPKKCNPNERLAVERAIDATRQLDTGDERIKLADMVFFRKSHTMEGAGAALFVSPRTAQRWHADFIREVGRNFGCTSLIYKEGENELPITHDRQAISDWVCTELSETQKETIILMAECDMNKAEVGRAAGVTAQGVKLRLQAIKQKIGIDPGTFYGLSTLVSMIRKEDTDVH